MWIFIYVFLVFLKTNSCLDGFEIEHIYVLNLDIRKDRWLKTKQQLESFGLSPVRFSAVNGWIMDRRKLKNLYKQRVENSCSSYLTPGQVGCFLSHTAVLKDAFIKGYNLIWVLEDDIIVLQNLNHINNLLKEMDSFDSNWDLLFTDIDTRGLDINEIWTFDSFLKHSFDYRLVREENFIPQENEFFKRIEYRLGAHSMFISKQGIKKLLEYLENHKISYPIDIQIHCCPAKRFYVSKQEFVTHGERCGSDTSFKPIL